MPEKINLNEDLVIEMYQSQNYNVASLARFFKVSSSPIKRILHKNNIKIRLHFSNSLHDTHRFCNICQVEQPIDNFAFCGNGNIYRMLCCKKCNLITRKERALKTKVILSIIEKECRKCKSTQSIDNFYTDLITLDGFTCICKKCYKQKNDNKKEYRRQRYKNLKLDEKAFSEHKRKQKEYLSIPENKKRNKTRINNYVKSRSSVDINFKLGYRLRNSLYKAIKSSNGEKFKSVIVLLGCSLEEFKKHIESLWAVGMTWENWGKGCDKWNIDHIKPCCSFDFTDFEQQKECFHFSNLRPLWETENTNKLHTNDKFLSIRKIK